MDYLELNIELKPRDPWAEILIAELADAGYESFVETEEGLLAYGRISEIDLDDPVRDTILSNNHPDFEAKIEQRIIPHENWNAKWEADFHPVQVEEYCTIIAPFHEQSVVKGLPVFIQPQMSFGTGHHQTTYMMTKALFELVSMPKNVLDMGTGTGVLAIVAEKLGAEKVVAVDIEDWSVENTMENAQRNQCEHILGICGDIDVVPHLNYGLILANINKNILKSHMHAYSNFLDEKGILLLSGFFTTDAKELIDHATNEGLVFEQQYTRDEWCCLKLRKDKKSA